MASWTGLDRRTALRGFTRSARLHRPASSSPSPAGAQPRKAITSPTATLAAVSPRARPRRNPDRARDAGPRHRGCHVRETPPASTVLDAGACDILVTTLPGIALVVQTADCVPVILAGPNAVGIAHAGWRGSAHNAAGAAVEELSRAGAPRQASAPGSGPRSAPAATKSAARSPRSSPGTSSRRSCDGRFTLDLRAVNRAQLEAAGLRSANISTHPPARAAAATASPPTAATAPPPAAVITSSPSLRSLRCHPEERSDEGSAPSISRADPSLHSG